MTRCSRIEPSLTEWAKRNLELHPTQGEQTRPPLQSRCHRSRWHVATCTAHSAGNSYGRESMRLRTQSAGVECVPNSTLTNVATVRANQLEALKA